MDRSNSNSDGRAGSSQDAILVTQLPTNMLLQDLKQLVLGHFANFGKILRYSCAKSSKGKREQTAHIQFSTVDAVRNALNNGKFMNGYRLSIIATDRHPTTQILVATPAGNPSTLTSSNTSSPSCSHSKQGVLDGYFRKNQDQDLKVTKPSESKPKVFPPTLNSPRSFVSPSVTTSSILSEEEPKLSCPLGNSEGVLPKPEIKRSKPNACVKLEIYRGETISCEPVGSPSTSSPLSSLSAATLPCQFSQQTNNYSGFQFQKVSRPGRTLREIFRFDIPQMKVVKNNVKPSEALACQFFTGGVGRHPFPLALMFGRVPGSIIMPVNSIMNSIKPGMEINQSSLEIIWNSLENGAIKRFVLDAAINNIKFEKRFGSVFPEEAKDFILNLIIKESAEKQLKLENERLWHCNDALENIIESVCKEVTVTCAVSELRLGREINDVANTRLNTFMEAHIARLVVGAAKEEYFNEFCKEVVNDLIECAFLDRCVEVIATNCLKRSRVEQEISTCYEQMERWVLAAEVKKVAKYELYGEFCREVVEDLFETNLLTLCVGVIAKDALAKFPNRVVDTQERSFTSSSSSSDDDESDNEDDELPSISINRRELTASWVEALSIDQSSLDSIKNEPSSRASTSSDSQFQAILPSTSISGDQIPSNLPHSSDSLAVPVADNCQTQEPTRLKRLIETLKRTFGSKNGDSTSSAKKRKKE